jgi:hypothetical protein
MQKPPKPHHSHFISAIRNAERDSSYDKSHTTTLNREADQSIGKDLQRRSLVLVVKICGGAVETTIWKWVGTSLRLRPPIDRAAPGPAV